MSFPLEAYAGIGCFLSEPSFARRLQKKRRYLQSPLRRESFPNALIHAVGRFVETFVSFETFASPIPSLLSSALR